MNKAELGFPNIRYVKYFVKINKLVVDYSIE